MDRQTLLGISAVLNVAHLMLARNRAYLDAVNHIVAAVVSVHERVEWTADELEKMGEIQNWVIQQIVEG